jgi:hypothetical protein
MKLNKVLSVAGNAVELVKDDVRLDLAAPGRANFTVVTSTPLRGLVTFDIGYNDKPMQRHFIGYVERSTPAGNQHQVLFCRELAAILANPLRMNLRHVTLREVLAEAGEQTGLTFRIPDQPYSNTKTAFFYSLAAGYQAMASLATVFRIPDFIWQQQGNGELYAGSWADSFWGQREPLQLPAEMFDGAQGNQSAMIAALPGLRPGATINDGQRITSVTLAGNHMAIKWTTQSAAL